jgi:hypothetical protein
MSILQRPLELHKSKLLTFKKNSGLKTTNHIEEIHYWIFWIFSYVYLIHVSYAMTFVWWKTPTMSFGLHEFVYVVNDVYKVLINIKENWRSNCHGQKKKVVIFLICKVLLRFYTYFHFKAYDAYAIDDYYYHKPCGYSSNNYTTKNCWCFCGPFE